MRVVFLNKYLSYASFFCIFAGKLEYQMLDFERFL